MAHVGDLYKTWFRQDVARRSNINRYGFPEAFRFFIRHEITSQRYVTEQLTGQLGINKSKAFERVWTSPVVGNFFDNCFWRITFLGDPNENETGIRFEVRHDAIVPTPLINVEYDFNRETVGYDAWRTRSPTAINFISPEVDFNPFNNQLDFVAARWAIYPPP